MSCLVLLIFSACGSETSNLAITSDYDVLIRNGLIYDGSGGQPFRGDVAITDDRIVAVGNVTGDAAQVIDAAGFAVAPGFINMLSWAVDSLLVDGRSQSDIRQGVTLEVFGEGSSQGPLIESMRTQMLARQGDLKFDIPWTTLDEYLQHLVTRGVATNVASFVGATTVRVHELGYEDRPPSDEELARMRGLVRAAMEDGALGLGSSLIYAPAFYASTDELIALAEVVGEYDGMYISHMRSEGNRLLESLDELISIARQADVAAEVYHLKMAGQKNWNKFDDVVQRIEAARAEGLAITANMYTYTAGASGLDASMPPWVQEGGFQAWAQRLQDPAIRARLAAQMSTPTDEWENLGLAAGAQGILLVGFRNEALRRYTGMTLAAVAEQRGSGPWETAMDLVVEDGSRVGVVYFLMSEENVAKGVTLPWLSFGSDAASMAAEGVFLKTSTHPRAYGNFARVLGKYARDDAVISLEAAIHKLTALPARNLKLRNRGTLAPGYFADVVIFDPATITDHATFAEPHQYATGVRDVLVNGVPVLSNGEHTGALPGQVVRGPGWRGWQN
jgi:N-acyl-D-amino-acid deacylase